jgi:hypothetical protein
MKLDGWIAGYYDGPIPKQLRIVGHEIARPIKSYDTAISIGGQFYYGLVAPLLPGKRLWFYLVKFPQGSDPGWYKLVDDMPISVSARALNAEGFKRLATKWLDSRGWPLLDHLIHEDLFE